MAEKKETVLTVRVETESKSLSALKAEFKETQKALEGLDVSSTKYVETLQKLGGIRDEIGDLNAEINAFNPEGKVQAFGNVIGGLASGFQAAQGAAALFGAEGEALQETLLKVQAASAFADGIKGVVGMGDAFKVLGNIIKANPLLLLATVLIGIGTLLFELKDKIGILGDAFDLITGTITKGIDALKSFTDWIGITSFAADDLAKKQIELAKKVGEATEKRYDKEIAFAKAAGKETIDLEIQKQAAVIASLKLQGKAYADAQDELVRLTIQRNTQIKDADEKAAKERADRRTKESKEFNKDLNETFDNITLGVQKTQEIRATTFQKNFDDEVKHEKGKYAQRAENLENFIAYSAEREELALKSTKELTDAFFAVQLSNAEGNAAKQEELRKKQFKVNKALSVSLAVIDGLRAVQAGLVKGPAFAAIAGVVAAANIAKILAVKYQGEDGGSGGAAQGALGAGAGGVAIAPPSSGNTQLNANGTVNIPASQETPVVKAIVTEVDITRTQRKINSIEEKAKIG